MSPPSGETFGGFFGGQGGEEEDRKQQLYKYLRVFAKTPDSPAHACNSARLDQGLSTGVLNASVCLMVCRLVPSLRPRK